MNKPEYSFADLVHIAGYGPRVFKIESFRIEHNYTPAEEWVDTVYDLTDVETGHYVEADEDELRLADGDGASVEENDLDGTGLDIFGFMGNFDSDTPRLVNRLVFEFGWTMESATELTPEERYEILSNLISGGGNNMAKEPRKPTARELSSQEAAKRKQDRKDRVSKVDDLLDLYNGYMAMFEQTGEAVYKENADDAMVRLAEVSSEK